MHRLYVALSVTYRYDIELFEPEEIRQQEWNRLRAWTDAKGIRAWMNSKERAIVEAEPGTLSKDQAFMASWAIECAGVCAWALQSYRWLRYDSPIDRDGYDLAKATQFLRDIPAGMALREEVELVAYQEMVRTCLWRLREYDRGRTCHDLKGIIARMEAIDLSAANIEFLDGDLCVCGGPINALDEDEYDSLYCSVQERFRTINWILVADGTDYHETDVDT
jgi:hypothetical protein